MTTSSNQPTLASDNETRKREAIENLHRLLDEASREDFYGVVRCEVSSQGGKLSRVRYSREVLGQ